jgi:hypothetical protein
MKQTTQMVDHYTATVFLQKENAGSDKVATKLIENITEMPKWFNADGSPMKKGAGLGDMMKDTKRAITEAVEKWKHIHKYSDCIQVRHGTEAWMSMRYWNRQ